MTADVTPESAGWDYSGLRIVDLPPEGTFCWDTGADEVVVVPLVGSVTVDADGERADLAGRTSVFAGPTDVAYVPRDSTLTLTSTPGGRFALATARARRRLPFCHVPVAQVQVELRGAGACSRQVNNFATPDVLEADRIIACEVLTPGGNWSSYPPHKHDEQRPGESVLEEIYYYEVARGGPAYQRVYGTDARPIDVLREVRSGDVVLIPYGWHGPSIAAPGYDLYYLNVMAGPGARSWLICDDPAHAWIRGTWADQPVDPRLPFTPDDPAPAVDGERR
ncbi:5-deoxy-glucuronate isomerase [Micromonospora endophytica]|uniref:5-deoxy-glucuronate isomerase n=1 Tax=Micromonospora endophytica TaxID=515350 RepID=A0A2W2E807_9ACTN|nr:5-deoxy-glucuronate isomerase [Micromonospora endophytica]PZG01054.1 5-deoxy-glucuronate isomerase [Micromonospora endophytica]RIW47904.1 5-deoxy-glucuronate isomerase [Micromonospora endophytica]BCJ62274.1 5-deoxy-glucuronate isomerase [Micromonospora endophytica]